MKARSYFLIGSVSVFFALLLFNSCAQPPTEKVATLQDGFNALEAASAQVFATSYYEKVSSELSKLKGLMDDKKYKQASILADSISLDLDSLKAEIESNGSRIAGQKLNTVSSQLDSMKAILTPQNQALIGSEESKNYQDQCAVFADGVSALQSELDNHAYLNAYNNSKPLEDKIANALRDLNQKLEQAKAKKAKGVAKPSPKVVPKPSQKAPSKKG